MKILSLGVAYIALTLVSRAEASEDKSSISSVQFPSRELGICGEWTKRGDTLKGHQEFDYYGTATASTRDGKVIAVSAQSNNGVGYVKVFSVNPQTNERTLLGNKILPVNWRGNPIVAKTLSLSDNGLSIAIGNVENANTASDPPTMSGGASVYDFDENTNSWEMRGDMIPFFGLLYQSSASVALSGDGQSYIFSSSGSAMGIHAKTKVYEWNDTYKKWTQKGKSISERTPGTYITDETSVSMSRDGNTIAIGSSRNSKNAGGESGKYHGRVRVFKYSLFAQDWVQEGTDILGDEGYSYFGSSVSLDDDGLTFIAGASGSNFNQGSAKIFKLSDKEWVKMGNDVIGPSKESFFGSSVAISSLPDNEFVIASGAYGDEQNSGTISVFKFQQASSTWVPLGGVISDVGLSHFFGTSIAMTKNGRSIVAGAPMSSYNGRNSGSAYVYALEEISCAPTISPTSSPSLTTSSNPSMQPSSEPSGFPSSEPSLLPTISEMPSLSITPSDSPSMSKLPSLPPSLIPTTVPSTSPTKSVHPSSSPQASPSSSPSTYPSSTPSFAPSTTPSFRPSHTPSETHSSFPSSQPSAKPTQIPTFSPSSLPSVKPTSTPSNHPSKLPTNSPTLSIHPSSKPSESAAPTNPLIVSAKKNTDTMPLSSANTKLSNFSTMIVGLAALSMLFV